MENKKINEKEQGFKFFNHKFSLSFKNSPRLTEDTGFAQLIPIIIFMSIVILIVRMYYYVPYAGKEYWMVASESTSEFFSHYKVIFIALAGVLISIILIYRIATYTLYVKKTYLYIPVGIYLFFTVLSYVLSEHKDVAWTGFNERFEGTFVIICYILVLVYVINTLKSEKDFKRIIYPLAVASIILSLIGISQFIDFDFFGTSIGQKLITGPEHWPGIDQAVAKGEEYLQFTFREREIYQTVYNINYVGLYLTLLIPLWLMVYLEATKLSARIFWAIVFGINLINMIGAASGAGIIAFAAQFILGIILFRNRIKKYLRQLVWIGVIAVFCLSISTDFWLRETTDAINTLSGGIFGVVVFPDKTKDDDSSFIYNSSDQESEGPVPEAWTSKIGYLTTKGMTLKFEINGQKGNATIVPTKDYEKLSKSATDMNKLYTVKFTDNKGKPLNSAYNKKYKYYYFNATKIEQVRHKVSDGLFTTSAMYKKLKKYYGKNKYKTFEALVNPLDMARFALYKDDKVKKPYLQLSFFDDNYTSFVFRIYNNKTLGFINIFGKKAPLTNIDRFKLFDGREDFISGRGYIWGRSIPILKHTILLGKGADTYIYYFPQNDYIGRYNINWGLNVTLDKPHCLYIAIGVNSGIIALVAFLIFLLMYFIQSFKLYFRRLPTDFISYVGFGLFIGVFGFSIAGITNDATVSTMPIFYSLFGTGIAANLILKKRYYEEEKELVKNGVNIKTYYKEQFNKEMKERKESNKLNREKRRNLRIAKLEKRNRK